MAAGLSYIGANIFMTYERYGDLIVYLHSVAPAFILIAAAFLIFLMGVIGICGLFSENKCLLSMYFTLLGSLFCLEIAGIVLAFVYRDNVNGFVKNLFDDALRGYGTMNGTRLTQNFDFIQYKFQCCGESNYTDWKHTWWYAHSNERAGSEVPQSCCANFVMSVEELSDMKSVSSRINGPYCTATSPVPTKLDAYNQQGCFELLKSKLQANFVYIALVFLALVLIQFTGLVATCILLCCRGKSMQQPPYINIATHEDAHYNL